MSRLIAALLVLLALPAVAPAQSAPAGAPAQMPVEIRRGDAPAEAKVGRITVRPPAQDSAAVRDAERASAELEQARRDQEFVRSQTPQPPRRPDLGYDVSSGLQQRNLRRALPR